MKKGLLKKDVSRLLVEERKKMRLANLESKFKRRTLNIFKNQKARAEELKLPLLYTIEEFRSHVKQAIELGTCYYCGGRITVTKFVCDHANPVSILGGSFTLSNTKICCQPCNCQKGSLSEAEFKWLNKAINENLTPFSAEDVRRRLSAGGKWLHGKF
jgi:5-methylcytosine-specific restriction endonuclease McrA